MTNQDNRLQYYRASFVLNLALIVIVITSLSVGNFTSEKSGIGNDDYPASQKPYSTVDEQRHAALPPIEQEEAHEALEQVDWREILNATNIPLHVQVAAYQADFENYWEEVQRTANRQYSDGQIDINDLALLGIDGEIELEEQMRNSLGESGYLEWDRARKFADVDQVSLALTPEEDRALYQLLVNKKQKTRELEQAKLKMKIDQASYEEMREQANAEFDSSLRDLIGYKRFEANRQAELPADVKRHLKELNIDSVQVTAVRNIESDYNEQQSELSVFSEYNQTTSKEVDHENDLLREWRQQEIRTILGEAAYTVYQKQNDPRYYQMKQFSDNWRMSDADIDHVFNTIVEFESVVRMRRIENHESGGDNVNELNLKISQIAQREEKELKDFLGEERFKALKENKIIQF